MIPLEVCSGSIASILTCPRYVRLAGNSGNVDWLLNGSTLGVIHLVYAPTSIRIRHPSCSPTVARRPADARDRANSRFPAAGLAHLLEDQQFASVTLLR